MAHRELGADTLIAMAENAGFNLRKLDERRVGIALDETITTADLRGLLGALGVSQADPEAIAAGVEAELPAPHARGSAARTPGCRGAR